MGAYPLPPDMIQKYNIFPTYINTTITFGGDAKQWQCPGFAIR
jgi:hypothetical protein